MHLPRTAHNWISTAGAMIAIIALFMIGFMLVISVGFNQGAAYGGILIYLLLPLVMIFGLILIPIGMWITRHRMRREEIGEIPPLPRLDLNIKSHRNAFLIFTFGSTFLLLISAVGTYQAYQFTDSVSFCAGLCHTLMQPEATARLRSAHARVGCVRCHIGPGATWYVRAKLGGLKQVWATLTDTYPRPIPVPIEHLRPIMIDCMECHWPTQFQPNVLRRETYFLADSTNTRWELTLEMHVSGGHPAAGLTSGSHWHVNPNIQMSYVYNDRIGQEILAVTVVDEADGTTVVYRDTTISAAVLQALPTREVDCLACHNRTTHRFYAPVRFINQRMADGAIPATLPDIRAQAVQLFGEPYPDRATALEAIASRLPAYYRKTYPALARTDSAQIFFPAMRVRWNDHPNNLGHLLNPGCFRCHGADLVDEAGNQIPRDCDLCHGILVQGEAGHLQVAPADSALTFRHPVDVGGAWQVIACTACHAGTGAG
jgi:hypothetical protein